MKLENFWLQRLIKFKTKVKSYLLDRVFGRLGSWTCSFSFFEKDDKPIFIEAKTDVTVECEERAVRLLSEHEVSIEQDYLEFAAEIQKLQEKLSAEEFTALMEHISNNQLHEQIFFPLELYMKAVRLSDYTELFHFCSVSQQPTLEWFQFLVKNDESKISVEPWLFLIHNFRVK